MYQKCRCIRGAINGPVSSISKTSWHGNCGGSLWPCDAIRLYRTRSTIVPTRACCLIAPNHHLYHCWITKISFNITYLKCRSNPTVVNELTLLQQNVDFTVLQTPHDSRTRHFEDYWYKNHFCPYASIISLICLTLLTIKFG